MLQTKFMARPSCLIASVKPAWYSESFQGADANAYPSVYGLYNCVVILLQDKIHILLVQLIQQKFR